MTPDDLGLGKMIAAAKPDFVGKRSLRYARSRARGPQAARRPAARRPDAEARRRRADRRGDEPAGRGRRRSATSPRPISARRFSARSRWRWWRAGARGSARPFTPPRMEDAAPARSSSRSSTTRKASASMPEAVRRSVLDGLAMPRNSAAAAAACPPATRFILRGGREAAARVGPAFGAAPPLRAFAQPDGGPALGAVDGSGRMAAARRGLRSRRSARSWRRRWPPIPHALVDVSHRQGAIELSGRGAARLLNAGVPLDLDLSAFPVGMVARTLLTKAEIVLWRRAPERLPRRIFALVRPLCRSDSRAGGGRSGIVLTPFAPRSRE